MKKTESNDCGPGCDCGKPSGNTKGKTIISLIVLLAICGIFVYKAYSAKQNASTNTEVAFSVPGATQADGQDAVVPAMDAGNTAVQMVEVRKKVGDALDSLVTLNKVAINQDAVFVFIPAQGDDTVDQKTTDAIASATQRLKTNNIRIGLYTLQSSSPQYAQIASQLSLPGMLVISKGFGMSGLSGEITETKLLQAYVASKSCGPSGCGPTGCK